MLMICLSSAYHPLMICAWSTLGTPVAVAVWRGPSATLAERRSKGFFWSGANVQFTVVWNRKGLTFSIWRLKWQTKCWAGQKQFWHVLTLLAPHGHMRLSQWWKKNGRDVAIAKLYIFYRFTLLPFYHFTILLFLPLPLRVEPLKPTTLSGPALCSKQYQDRGCLFVGPVGLDRLYNLYDSQPLDGFTDLKIS